MLLVDSLQECKLLSSQLSRSWQWHGRSRVGHAILSSYFALEYLFPKGSKTKIKSKKIRKALQLCILKKERSKIARYVFMNVLHTTMYYNATKNGHWRGIRDNSLELLQSMTSNPISFEFSRVLWYVTSKEIRQTYRLHLTKRGKIQMK